MAGPDVLVLGRTSLVPGETEEPLWWQSLALSPRGMGLFICSVAGSGHPVEQGHVFLALSFLAQELRPTGMNTYQRPFSSSQKCKQVAQIPKLIFSQTTGSFA